MDKDNLLADRKHFELSHHLAHAWSVAATAPFEVKTGLNTEKGLNYYHLSTSTALTLNPFCNCSPAWY